MTALAVHYSSATPEWYTPPAILERVVRVLGSIDLDPCSDGPTSLVPASRRLTRADDGLAQLWSGRVFLNPPYGRDIGRWVEKLVSSYEQGHVAEAIALLPARTDTTWFAVLASYPVCFVRGRVRFVGASSGAPFPSAVVYLGRNPLRFYDVFCDLGQIRPPAYHSGRTPRQAVLF
jgi:hypothetical protein